MQWKASTGSHALGISAPARLLVAAGCYVGVKGGAELGFPGSIQSQKPSCSRVTVTSCGLHQLMVLG